MERATGHHSLHGLGKDVTRKRLAPVLIVDTAILIDDLLGVAEANACWRGMLWEDRDTTALASMEISRGARNTPAMTLFKRLFVTSVAEIIHTDEHVSKKVVELIEVYTLSHGLLLADGLIAATALWRGARLITGHSRHFAYIPGLDIFVPPYRSSGS